MIQDKQRDLAELEFLAGSLESDDLFVETYVEMLEECRRTKDMAKTRKMRELLFRQFIFLFGEWRKEKGLLPADESRKAQGTS